MKKKDKTHNHLDRSFMTLETRTMFYLPCHLTSFHVYVRPAAATSSWMAIKGKDFSWSGGYHISSRNVPEEESSDITFIVHW